MVNKRRGILGCSCRLCYVLMEIKGLKYIKVLAGKRNILTSRDEVNVHVARHN